MNNTDNNGSSEDFSQMASEMTSRFWESSAPLMTPKPSDFDNFIIFHYTNLSAAINIIENQEIWATNIGFLNDEHELVCAQNVFINTVRDKDYREKNEFYLPFCDELEEKIRNELTHQSYVVSFCEHGDSLGQWRGYGSGVSIGFNAKEMMSFCEEIRLVKVLYDPTIQSQITKNLISSFCEYLILNKKSLNYDERRKEAVRLANNYHNFTASQMKNASFQEEMEWRIVRNRPFGLNPSENPEVLFREKNGFIAPYIKMKPKSGRLPIKGIFMSPNSHPTLKYSLEELLRKNGYTEAPVLKSKIPFKG
jgi:hypothetical protein